MLDSTFLFVVAGCLVGTLQLAVGIVLGMRLFQKKSSGAGRAQEGLIQASRITQRLQALADDVSSSVGEHRGQIEQASRQLTAKNADGDRSLADLVIGVIGHIVEANQVLQSKLESSESRLQEQAAEIEAHISRAMTDALTGLPNRRQFDEQLEAVLSAWRRRGQGFTLMMLDVDHFKKLNDKYGHVAGDQMLVAVGRALRDAVRREDVVARYGGEEFALLLPATSLEQSRAVAEKVRRTVAQAALEYEGQAISVTASGGLAMISANENGSSLVARADAALYAAKTAGRNCVFVHDGSRCLALEQHRPSSAEAAVPPQIQSTADESAQLSLLLEMVESLVQSNTGQSEHAASAGIAQSAQGHTSAQLAETCAELRRFMFRRG